MKKIIRLTESDLHKIIENSVKRILKEDVLGNDWRQRENNVLNNYEPFEDQVNQDEHNWSGQGEENIDPTFYNDQHLDVQGWNDDEPEGYNNMNLGGW